MKKLFYLFLALLLPGLIFVFLKYAGKNEFKVPVYFETALDPLPECSYSYSVPYILPDSATKLGAMTMPANVLVFPNEGMDFPKIASAIEGEFGRNEVWLGDAATLVADTLSYRKWKSCIFIVKEPFQSVLVDGEKRVRGYYDLRLREEEDRLRVELKILLNKY